MIQRLNLNALTPTQINELIHEHIMGQPILCPGRTKSTWGKPSQFELNEYDVDEYVNGWMCLQCGRRGKDPRNHAHTIMVPNYWQDLNAAWRIVFYINHLKREGTTQRGKENIEVINDFINELGGDGFLEIIRVACVSGWTPADICKAALSAFDFHVIEEGNDDTPPSTTSENIINTNPALPVTSPSEVQ